MPSSLVRSYAKKSGKSVKAVEAKWKEAKKAAGKTYDPETNPGAYWGTVNKITRRKLRLGESVMEEFVSEMELKKLIESGFNCKIDYMRLDEGYLALIAKIGNDINFELDYDREKFFPNTITGMVDRCKYDTYFSEPKNVEEFLSNMLSSVADEYGFRYTREWVNGVNVSNIFKALEMIRSVVNNEAILDEDE